MDAVSRSAACIHINPVARRELTFDGELTLYMKEKCPWCNRVKNWLNEHEIELEQKDIVEDPDAREELWEGGGRIVVPCLKHGEEWLYESRDIIAWLEENSRPV